MKTYTETSTVNLKSCLKDLKWLIKNYSDLKDSGWCGGRLVVPTERGIFDLDIGLCCNFLIPNGINGDEQLWYDWSDYSGNESYPVAGESEYEDSEHLYLTDHRKRLAQHCAAKIKAELRSRGDVC